MDWQELNEAYEAAKLTALVESYSRLILLVKKKLTVRGEVNHPDATEGELAVSKALNDLILDLEKELYETKIKVNSTFN